MATLRMRRALSEPGARTSSNAKRQRPAPAAVPAFPTFTIPEAQAYLDDIDGERAGRARSIFNEGGIRKREICGLTISGPSASLLPVPFDVRT